MLLGEILIRDFNVSETDIQRGLEFQKKYGGRLGAVLINMGVISENVFLNALSRQLGCDLYAAFSRENEVDVPTDEFWEQFNFPFLKKKECVPLCADPQTEQYCFAVRDPLDLELIEYLESKTPSFQFVLCSQQELRELSLDFEQSYEEARGFDHPTVEISEDEIEKLKEMAAEAPIINLVNTLIARGVERNASDLHLEPRGNMYRVRYRIDGILYDADLLPDSVRLPVTSRIKILSGMDIAEKRLPQDGKIAMRLAGREMDIRVSALPLTRGESLVLRLLLKDTEFVELDKLGLATDTLALVEKDIQRNRGIFLITGPTGSGKSTTLYAILKRINRPSVKIITVEDPVEYQLEGINQIQVLPDLGYDFSNALRAIVRQDPDVIMVGEIRDRPTAEIAMQASLTGHLVFSTLHTNDALGAINRLLDLGVEEFLINGTIIALSAQRLIRKICPHCKAADPEASVLLGQDGVRSVAERVISTDTVLYKGEGCERCSHTGFSGRIPIMEYIPYDATMRLMKKDAAFHNKAWEYQAAQGRRTLMEDGLLRVRNGMTSIREVLRVA